MLGVGLELGFELSSARDGFGGRHAVERDGGEVGEELASADDAAGHVVGYTGFIGSLALGVGDVGDGALGAAVGGGDGGFERASPTEFLITTGPGPAPSLDGENVVFGR